MVETRNLKVDGLGAIGDDFYQVLMEVHEGLSYEQSNALNARLVLSMANRIGDLEVLSAILDAARSNG